MIIDYKATQQNLFIQTHTASGYDQNFVSY